MKRTGFLETPILIGKVSAVKADEKSPMLWDVTVQPACDVQTLATVTVIVMDPPDETGP
jgi:cell shape-determining protein MreC